LTGLLIPPTLRMGKGKQWTLQRFELRVRLRPF
jgi:hypothetical protein